MQIANPKHSSIGCVGVALGCVAEAKVCESIAWVNQFNLTSKHMSDIEFGFGNIELNDTGDDFISMLQFEALSPAQIDEIEEKGMFSRSNTQGERTAPISPRTGLAQIAIIGLSPETGP